MGDAEPAANPLETLARHVRLRRRELQISQDDAARSVGMSPVTWGRVEKGQPVRALTHSGIERALGWAPGSVETILSGGEPTEAEAEPPERPSVMDDPLIADILATDLPDDEKAKLIHMVLKDRRRSEELRRERVREQIETYRRWQKGA